MPGEKQEPLGSPDLLLASLIVPFVFVTKNISVRSDFTFTWAIQLADFID